MFSPGHTKASVCSCGGMWGRKRTPGRLGPVLKPVFGRKSSSIEEAVAATQWHEKQASSPEEERATNGSTGGRCDFAGLRRAPGRKGPEAAGLYSTSSPESFPGGQQQCHKRRHEMLFSSWALGFVSILFRCLLLGSFP